MIERCSIVTLIDDTYEESRRLRMYKVQGGGSGRLIKSQLKTKQANEGFTLGLLPEKNIHNQNFQGYELK